MTDTKQNDGTEELARQYGQRLMMQHEQVLKVLQEAAASIYQAQQLLQADMAFHKEMQESGRIEAWKAAGGPQMKPENPLPTWPPGRTPHLQ
jgi:hypothetical protein